MANALRRIHHRQLDLYESSLPWRLEQRRAVWRVPHPAIPRCAGCRAKEARYGFRDEEGDDRPSTLCFECFRLEILRRQATAARAPRITPPLSDTLHQIDLRRRRAQIAARRVLGRG